MKSLLIAPCGMNCGICLAYLREKNRCPGCRGPDENKSNSCVRCRIKTCRTRSKKAKFCIQCIDSPCDRLKHLDKRYRLKYHMSMIENLKYIKESGVRKFLQNEKTRWACQKCGGTICVHRGYCLKCRT
jgi:hypothetical protein